jgi:addiction module RelE/StbE family toxin
MRRVLFTPDARTDLQEIRDYITVELRDPEAAERILSEIMARVRALYDFPLAGASLDSVVKYHTDYRFLVCGNYTVFYRVCHDAVQVSRVLYGRRDFMSVLFRK